MRITKAALKKWLNDNADRVFNRCDRCTCPVACFLSEVIGGEWQTSYTVSRTKLNERKYAHPVWLTDFIYSVDGQGFTITGAAAAWLVPR